MYCNGISLERLKKITTDLSHYIQYPCRDSNHVPPVYKLLLHELARSSMRDLVLAHPTKCYITQLWR
jgi:hypothetical protein